MNSENKHEEYKNHPCEHIFTHITHCIHSHVSNTELSQVAIIPGAWRIVDPTILWILTRHDIPNMVPLNVYI